MDRVGLRATFDEVPELYDRARPTYPDALFDDLGALVGDRPRHGGLRLLEIGPGTGKATVALVARGYEVTAVELGERLAAVARRNVVRCDVKCRFSGRAWRSGRRSAAAPTHADRAARPAPQAGSAAGCRGCRRR